MRIIHFAFMVLFFVPLVLTAQIKLPKLISTGMVLQRNHEIKIWGWASAAEQISINFLDSEYKAQANKSGEWLVKIPAQHAGGPYKMKLTGLNEITIDSIFFGDVWLCSGQSNMELNMERVSPLYQNDITEANYNEIRYFHVPREFDFNRQRNDLSYGKWKAVTPKNVLSFSAVSYFFALELHQKYKVPIGIINSALGGSPIECWIDEEHLKNFPTAYNALQKFKDSSYVNQIKNRDRKREHEWHSHMNSVDKGFTNPNALWKNPDTSIDNWELFNLPGYFKEEKNGVIWVKRTFNTPESMIGKEAKLNFGCVVDADSIYVNGVFVGNTTYRYPPRRYTIPDNVLKPGKNTIAVRVISRIEPGGFVEDKAYEITCNNDTINLIGNWKYKYGAELEPLQRQTFIRWQPAGLYNAMVSPLTKYTIKGALWYQGESNTHNPKQYRELLPVMIKTWRSGWNQSSFPVLVVQLPNYLKDKQEPSESIWAMLRESQSQILSVENTALTVNIDLGEWNDIHPLNKKDVSKRLVLAAQKLAYDEKNMVHSGPIFKNMQCIENKIVLSFTEIGSGLTSKNGALKEFAIAGSNKKFVWANAKIEGDKVIVWSETVTNPIAVRYAWADNPAKANLYNNEGLPASPFRTDDW